MSKLDLSLANILTGLRKMAHQKLNQGGNRMTSVDLAVYVMAISSVIDTTLTIMEKFL